MYHSKNFLVLLEALFILFIAETVWSTPLTQVCNCASAAAAAAASVQ
jgi:hypothetical protein